MNQFSLPRVPVKSLLAAIAVGLFAIPAAADAATRYAAPDGDGPAATCPESDPCELQTAVEHASVNDGDVVVVADGTYSIFADPLQVTKAITVRGPEPGVRPEITGGGPGRFDVITPYGGAKLQDLDLRQFSGELGLYAINGAVIERVSVYGDSSYTCAIQAATLRDTVCANEKPLGRALRMSLEGATTTSRLRNVTAVARHTNSIGIEVETISSNVTLDARSVIASGTAFDVQASTFNAAGQATATLVDSNYSTVNTQGAGQESITPIATAGNQTGEPAFVNPTVADYRQVEGSPTIDKGSTDAQSGASDLDGEARSMGPAPDIGADEFTVVPPDEEEPPPDDGENPPPAADKQAPETSLTATPKRKLKTKKRSVSVAIRYASSEPGSTFECSLDGAPFKACSDAYTAKVRKGKHSFRVRAIDAAGNVDGTPAEARWTVKRKRKR